MAPDAMQKTSRSPSSLLSFMRFTDSPLALSEPHLPSTDKVTSSEAIRKAPYPLQAASATPPNTVPVASNPPGLASSTQKVQGRRTAVTWFSIAYTLPAVDSAGCRMEVGIDFTPGPRARGLQDSGLKHLCFF